MANNPLHAAYYADHAVQRTAAVLANHRLARDTHRVRIECPDIASSIVPGQFVMLRLTGCDDPLIGRPLALYDSVLSTSGEPYAIDVVYLVKGKFTRRLEECTTGQKLDVWGPLGNGFASCSSEHLIMVAGGIGQTPFVALAQESLGRRRYGHPPRTAGACARVTLCYGARTAGLLAGVEDFQQLGVEVQLATEDGTCGHRGLVTELLERLLRQTGATRRVVCCGPEPMLRAVASLAAAARTPCEVSLETPMACGIGICFSCVVKVRDGAGGWDYRRSCVEGPVFDAAAIEW